MQQYSTEDINRIERELNKVVLEYDVLEKRLVDILDILIGYQMNLSFELKDMEKLNDYIDLKHRIKSKKLSFWII